jgi:hypothetical protein
MNRSDLRPAHDVERDGLVGVAAETANLEAAIARVERVAEGWGWLRRSLVAEHSHVPGVASQLIGFPGGGACFARSADMAIEVSV